MRLDELPTNEEWDSWEYILPGGNYTEYSGTSSVHDGATVDDITAERIARVDAWFGDSPEGYGSQDFAALVELSDGTWATCLAWADTTGWGCQCGVEWKWAQTRDDAIAQGLDRDARKRLGVPLPTELAVE